MDGGAGDDRPCLLCANEEASDASVVFRDELWAAEVLPGHEVPGWVVLRVRRHAERITGLSDHEIDAFGRHARDLVAAITEVNGTPVTYMLAFGENFPHFHVLVVPRGDDVAADRRGGSILHLLAERADPARAIALVPLLRDALTRTRQGRAAAGAGASPVGAA